MRGRPGPSALIEREGELEAIEAALAAAVAGTGGALLIEGAPGIGKTALIEAACALAEQREIDVFTARGAALEQELGFGVVRTLFERPLRDLERAARDELLAGAAHLAEAPLGLAGEGAAAPPVPAPGADLHGLYWLVANLADRRPLLLAIDDLHWADLPSLRFLSFLSRRLGEHPILLCAASRPLADESRLRPALAAHSAEWGRVLSPRPLSEAGVGAVVRATLEAEPETEFSAACARSSGGNPFLLITALRALRGDGIAPSASAARRIERLRPADLSHTLVARLGRAGPDAAKLAHALAVLGSDATLRRAARLAELEPEAAAATIAALRREGILADHGLGFVHPLVGNVVYADLAEPARGLLHLRTARLLEEDGEDRRLIARHLQIAEPAGDRWVVATLRAVAAAALGDGAPESAVAHLERALAEPPAAPERAGVCAELGVALARAGRLEAGAAAMREALAQASDKRVRTEVALGLGEILFVARRYADALEVRERARRELDPDDDSELALQLEVEIAFARHMILEPDWIGPLEAAAGRATASGQAGRAATALLAYAAAGSGRASAEQVGRLAHSAAQDGPAPDESVLLVPFAAASLALVERPEAGIELLDRGIAAARSAGDAPRLSFCFSFRSRMSLEAGRAHDAEADARAALAAHQAGAASFSFALAVLVLALVERGEIAAAQEMVDEHGEVADAERDLFPYCNYLWARGRMRSAQGRYREAVADLLGCGATLARTGFASPVNAPWRSGAALAHHALGEVEQARELATQELELARAHGARTSAGIALRAIGLIEGGERGLTALRESVATLDSSAAALQRARSLAALGGALRRANRRREAREPLRSCIELARRAGAPALAEHAHTELRATGARPRRLVLSGIDSLTPSERRVAEMAAGGLANREIAQALYVTKKTVEYHLSNAYAKLGVGSRDELPRMLAG